MPGHPIKTTIAREIKSSRNVLHVIQGMKELYKPHDSFFHSVFSQKKNTRDLVPGALPDVILKALDLESIEVSRESFIDRKLATHQSDILIRTRLRKSPVLI